MSPLVIALVLGAAVLHASWNAILRSGQDRLWSVVVMGAICGLVALPVALIVPHPAMASWPYMAASASLQIVYCLLLVRMYREGQLAHVYPIARGAAPLLVTLGAAVFAGEQLTPLSLLGVLLVSAGIVAIAFGKGRPDIRTSLWALAAGAFIAAYMVVDGLGVRLSGHAVGYAAAQSVVQGLPMPLVFFALRRRWPRVRIEPGFGRIVVGAVISASAYGVVVWAMSFSPMGQVSALRETSILFAAIIGAAFLKERLTLQRLVGAAMIAGGAVVLSLS